MFRRSHLTVLLFACLFLLAGVLNAYARCFDGPQAFFSERSENGNWHIEQSYLDGGLHCSEERTVYAIGQLNKQRPTFKKVTTHSATIALKAADHQFIYKIASVASASLLPPRQRLPLYQLEVVYRI